VSTEVTKHSFHSSRKMHEMTIEFWTYSLCAIGRKPTLMMLPSCCGQNWINRRLQVHSSFDQPIAIVLRSPLSLRTTLWEYVAP
jgi:hypothetical protein